MVIHASPEIVRRRSANALIVLAVIATAAALYAARWFFVPALLGCTLAAMLLPVVGWLARLHVPAPLGAAVTVLASCAILVGIGIALADPVRDLAEQVPQSITAARIKLLGMGEPYNRLARLGLSKAEADRQARRAASPHAAARPPAPAASDSTAIVPTQATASYVVNVASGLLGEFVEVVLLAAFILGAGDGWAEKLGQVVRDPERHRTFMEVVADVRSVVARYLVVTLLINIGQAVAIGLGLLVLGYPTVPLWAALTFLLEFIPYFGGLIMVVLLLIVGFGSGQSFLHALAGPALYLLVTTIQNNVVSPVAYGRGLRLNPTALLLALIFFWGLWGVAGAFLAVPILAAVRVVATKIDSLNGVAAFVGD